MISNKEKMHAIGNYLRERFGYEWYFKDATSLNPNIISFSDIDIMVTFSYEQNRWLVFKEYGDGTKGTYCDTPMQVINHIITRKYEVI